MIEHVLSAVTRPFVSDRCLRTGENWCWYYRGSVHWWNLRLWVGDASKPWSA